MFIKLSFSSETKDFIYALDNFSEEQNPTSTFRMNYLKESGLISPFFYIKDRGNNFSYYINIVDQNNQDQVVDYFNDWLTELVRNFKAIPITFEIHKDFLEDCTLYERVGF